jgi:hypothetical protein
MNQAKGLLTIGRGGSASAGASWAQLPVTRIVTPYGRKQSGTAPELLHWIQVSQRDSGPTGALSTKYIQTKPFLLLSFLALLLWGCAATQVALEKKDLSVQTQMSDTIFLDLEEGVQRTVYVDLRNTSDKHLEVEPLVREKLQAKGYTITSRPQDAYYILQVNILYVDKADPSALRTAMTAGYGAPLGALSGAMIGGATHGGTGAVYGAGIGAIVGGAAEVVAGSLVKDVTYGMVTDVQISERTREQVHQQIESELKQGKGTKVMQQSASVRERRKYQTRILSTANKVNLKFEEAAPALTQGLAMAIAGIF